MPEPAVPRAAAAPCGAPAARSGRVRAGTGAALALGVAGAGVAVAAGLLDPDPPVVLRQPTAGDGTVLAPDRDLHLLRRATFGPTPTLTAEVAEIGPEAWLERQLRPADIPDPDVDRALTAYPLLSRPAADLQRLLGGRSDRREAVEQLVAATLIRQIWSRRQLFEVMVDFWSNHFNVTTPLGPTYATKPVEDREVIRAHALGRFEDLLLADAQSPAMLIHLGNGESTGAEPNENYGRELLELHTVGIDGGYTEDDVRASALALTGWTVAEDGTFAFAPDRHYTGRVKVLAWTSPNAAAANGLGVGRDYLRYLAHHPATARHLSHKLALRFVSDDPPAALVDRLAETFLAADTAIVPWLRELFGSPEFAASVGAKVRRPLEDVVAGVRALGIGPPTGETAGVAALVERTRSLGQAPLGAAPPTGYPDVEAEWLSTSALLGRWNVHRLLTSGFFAGLSYPDLAATAAELAPVTDGELVDRVCTRLTGQSFAAGPRRALLDFLGTDPDTPYAAERRAGQLPDLFALVLDSPYHLLR